MATARDLERLLTASGLSSSRLDTTNRLLRERGNLPKQGRGPYAPLISTSDAAAIVLAYFGCSKSVHAADRLDKLKTLPSSKDGRLLLAVIRDLIEEPVGVRELRISRVRRRARMMMTDGTEITFAPPSSNKAAGRFESEATIDALMFANISALLNGNAPRLIMADENEDSE